MFELISGQNSWQMHQDTAEEVPGRKPGKKFIFFCQDKGEIKNQGLADNRQKLNILTPMCLSSRKKVTYQI